MDGNGLNIFDYIDEMKKAGMPHEQADAVGKALGKVASEGAATKHDLEFAKLELKKDIEGINLKIEGVRAELKRDIKKPGRSDRHEDGHHFRKFCDFDPRLAGDAGKTGAFVADRLKKPKNRF